MTESLEKPALTEPGGEDYQAGWRLSGQRSSLGWRIASRIAAIFLLFGLVQFFLVREITRRQFQAIERTNLLDRTRQVFLTFDREAAALKTITASTAAWRDTYDFAARPTEGYLERNFGGDWPKVYHVDFVLFVGVDGKRIWSSEGYPTFTLSGPPAFAAERFETTDPFLFPKGGPPWPSDEFIGLIGSGDRTWIYCAHAITNDDLTAAPRGMLLFGRNIDQKTLSSFTFGHRDDLTLVDPGRTPAPGVSDDHLITGEFPAFGGTRTAIRREGDTIVSYSPINDAGGRLLAALRLSIPRSTEAAGARLVWLMSISLLVIAFITLGVILIAVRTTVILPISRLASFFTAQAEGREEILKITARRGDEIGVLAERASALMTKVKEQNAELENQANTDRLTGLANRRRFESHIGQELRRILRYRRGNAHRNQLAVVIIDVDHFKLYNDANGHMAGDACLRALAETIQACTHRPGDLACRFGGEEFILVLPDTDEAGALVVAETTRAAVQGLSLPHPTSPVVSVVTVSIGAAAEEVAEGFDIGPLIERADQALYAAKHAGRNRVVGSSSLGDDVSA